MASNNGTRFTFTTLQDLYSDSKAGKKRLKRNLKLKYECYITDICSVSETCNTKGEVYKDRCRILHEQDGAFIVEGSRDRIAEVVFGKQVNSNIGFNSNKSDDN